MKLYLLAISLTSSAFIFSENNEIARETHFITSPRKRILILSSKGGGGHTAAANAIDNYLKKDYDIKTVNAFCDIFGQCDPVKKLSFGYADAEEFYNFLLKNRLNLLINLYNYVGLFFAKAAREILADILYSYIKENGFDFLISITPYINGIALSVAKKLNIPFVIIPTDLNSENFAYDLRETGYEKFNYVLPFQDDLLVEKIKYAKIPESKIRFIGYPLREDFFTEKNIASIKEEWKIPKNKPVCMILMGAAGSSATYLHAFTLSKYKYPLHLIICLGKSDWLKKKIKRIKFPKHITVTVVNFTDKIADLMAASDIIDTKAGTHSVCEAIQSRLPIIIDGINTALEWENLNSPYIKKQAYGEPLTDYSDLCLHVEKILKNSCYKQNLVAQRNYNFGQNIKGLITDLMP